MRSSFILEGIVIDPLRGTMLPERITVRAGVIHSRQVIPTSSRKIISSLHIDAHGHEESTLLSPISRAMASLRHGTGVGVWDPHEIANVLGIDGVRYMVALCDKVPFYSANGVPSCVPALPGCETNGATFRAAEIEQMFRELGLTHLSEMMNGPGVRKKVKSVWDILAVPKRLGYPIDGHDPGSFGEEAGEYILAGMSSDHECITLNEAKNKLDRGLKLLQVREGSAACNLDALLPLFLEDKYAARLAFCTDDLQPNHLRDGHIDLHIRRALDFGVPPLNVFRAACVNPALHYNIGCGLLRIGDPADLVVASDLEEYRIEQTYVRGVKVAENGQTLFDAPVHPQPINNFHCSEISPDRLKIRVECELMRVIGAIDGQLITESLLERPHRVGDFAESDLSRDILKLAVVRRYPGEGDAVSVFFMKGTGLREGAYGATVAHDCHNILVVGTNDADIARVINRLIHAKGGLCAARGSEELLLPLPIAGLMSLEDVDTVALAFERIDGFVKETLGSTLFAPFMTLSFMALPVIGRLKATDKGLFDLSEFKHVPLFIGR